ncbi:unnamed protein product [Paramecium pentaurelia]|uniref:Uncharacterized protein n=1 Tax=Paramecium pentaurelia TaxID=43138 RepID=A0A8S1UVN8_9CILI|nr:unnamed protein product [Paramecium pentaurelia]
MFSLQSFNSKESLDEFLPMFHNKDNKKAIIYQKEQNIIKYLKQIGLIMKTDPLKKQQEHYQKTKIIEVFVSQTENDGSDEEERSLSTNEVSPSEVNANEFCIFNNPFLLKGRKLDLERKHSFENLDLQ